VKCGRQIAWGMMALATIACVDRDAELREEFRVASLALVDQRVPGSNKTVIGSDGWLFTWGEVRYLKAGSYIGENALRANHHAPPEYADPVPAIVDFHRQLQERGIEMYFMPVPVRMRRILLETEEGFKEFGLNHPQSPVIVIGDSNSRTWSRFSSGLPHSLAFELGFPVDVLSTAGGGANTSRLNLARKIRAEPEYLEGKRVVI